MKLAIVDIGYGNVGSIGIAFERFGLTPEVTSDPQAIAGADKSHRSTIALTHQRRQGSRSSQGDAYESKRAN